MYVSRKTLAQCLNLSERRITQLRHKGITKKSVFNGYLLEESVSGYLRYKLALCQHRKKGDEKHGS